MFWFREKDIKENYKIILIFSALILLGTYIFNEHYIIQYIISFLTAYGILLTAKVLIKRVTQREESFKEIYFFIINLCGWCCAFLLSYELFNMFMTSIEEETNQTNSQEIIYIFSVIFALSIEQLVMLEQEK